MNNCKECNTELTDDIKYTDDYCCPCYEKKTDDDYEKHIQHLLETGEMIQCEYCGNIWDGHAQCNCWEWTNIFHDDEEEYDNDYFEPTSVADVYILDIIYKYD
jgi:hypothetical protein